MKRVTAKKELAKDFGFIILGAIIAIILSEVGIIQGIVNFLGGQVVASFVAGIFFTSVFTIAPAAIVLANIGQHFNPHTVAIVGALGATCGDLVLFLFIRDRFSEDLLHSLKPSFMKKIFRSFHFGFLKWLSPILGALIIASPLPDELGLTLLGLSKTRVMTLLPIAFVMNVVGIYIITYFSNNL